MLAVLNGNILDGTGKLLEKATIIITDGKIKEIGQSVSVPDGCRVIDAAGKMITPGLIDVHTHLGIEEMGIGSEGSDLNEETSALTPEVRALDGINVCESGFEDARSAGVTTVQILPGSSNVIGGEMVTLKTHGTIVDDMILRSPSGMKAAMGENPKVVHGEKGRAPQTRMGIAALLRESFINAQTYKEKRERQEVERDLGKENLVKVLNKEIPLRVHAHRADDIISALRIKREFDIDLTIEHCTEGHKIADYLANSGVKVSVGPTLSPRSKVELADKGWHTLKILADAQVPFVITTDHSVVGIEYLMASAILSVKHGLTEHLALQAITLHAAEYLGVSNRVGSLEPGKDADMVIWDGDVFDLRTNVVTTIINGKVVFNR